MSEEERREKNKVSEEPATPKQIKKLYAVLYHLNIAPKDYLEEKQLTGFNHLGKREISKIIDELEETGAHFIPNSKHSEQQPQQQEEVVEDVTDKDNEKDTVDPIEEKGKVLRKCLDVASKIAIGTHTLNTFSDEYQKTSVILELARTLFEHRNK